MRSASVETYTLLRGAARRNPSICSIVRSRMKRGATMPAATIPGLPEALVDERRHGHEPREVVLDVLALTDGMGLCEVVHEVEVQAVELVEHIGVRRELGGRDGVVERPSQQGCRGPLLRRHRLG